MALGRLEWSGTSSEVHNLEAMMATKIKRHWRSNKNRKAYLRRDWEMRVTSGLDDQCLGRFIYILRKFYSPGRDKEKLMWILKNRGSNSLDLISNLRLARLALDELAKMEVVSPESHEKSGKALRAYLLESLEDVKRHFGDAEVTRFYHQFAVSLRKISRLESVNCCPYCVAFSLQISSFMTETEIEFVARARKTKLLYLIQSQTLLFERIFGVATEKEQLLHLIKPQFVMRAIESSFQGLNANQILGYLSNLSFILQHGSSSDLLFIETINSALAAAQTDILDGQSAQKNQYFHPIFKVDSFKYCCNCLDVSKSWVSIFISLS